MKNNVAAQIEDFFKQYRVRHYSKGQILIFNDDMPEYVYNLIEGHVKQYDVSY